MRLARRAVVGPVYDLLYPTTCGGCGREGHVFCPSCAEAVMPLDSSSVCPVCGRWTGSPAICGACTLDPLPFERGYYGFSFRGPFREAIHAFKFGGRKDVGRTLARMAAGRLPPLAGAFDVVVPVPVTAGRLKERGFNQSFIVAEEIARLSGASLDYTTLRKVRETKDQYTLSRTDRRRDIRGAFSLHDDGRAVRGRRLLVVDDLATTLATAREAARTLRRAHPAGILFFALAKTPE
jgi:ComF family protein